MQKILYNPNTKRDPNFNSKNRYSTYTSKLWLAHCAITTASEDWRTGDVSNLRMCRLIVVRRVASFES